MSDDRAVDAQPIRSPRDAAPADDAVGGASSRPERAGEEREEEEGEPKPDIRDLERLFVGPIDIRSVALTGLFLFASILMLRFGKELFLPIVLAVLFKFLLNPVIRFMGRARIPVPLASLLVVLGTVAALGFVAWRTYEPAQAWLVRLPEALQQAEDKLEQLRKPVEAVTEVARQVDELAGDDPAQDALEVRPATLSETLVGAAVALAMTALDMPSPLFWGAMATCLNYVPYLGLAVGTATLALAAFLQYDPLPQMLLPPLAYVALSILEANLVTPLILGRRLALNPVAVFLGLFFWGWLWGIPGALLAVPLLVALKIFCDRVPPFAALGEFLGR